MIQSFIEKFGPYETEVQPGVSLVNLRHPGTWEAYPILTEVREGFIAAYDFLEDAHGKWVTFGKRNVYDMHSMSKSMSDLNDDEISALMEFDALSVGQCKETSTLVANYLLTNFRLQYIISEYQIDKPKYFPCHYFGVAFHLPTKTFIAFSPGNIFNFISNNYSYTQNTNDQIYQRSCEVLISHSLADLVNGVLSFEGGSIKNIVPYNGNPIESGICLGDPKYESKLYTGKMLSSEVFTKDRIVDHPMYEEV